MTLPVNDPPIFGRECCYIPHGLLKQTFQVSGADIPFGCSHHECQTEFSFNFTKGIS
jgi:hypothetical protein